MGQALSIPVAPLRMRSAASHTALQGQWGSWDVGQGRDSPREPQDPVLADLSESYGCQTSVLSPTKERDFGALLSTRFLTCNAEATLPLLRSCCWDRCDNVH